MATTTTSAAPGPFPSETITETAESMPSAPVTSNAPAPVASVSEDTAESAAAAAALVVDSVVESTVAAVLTSNHIPPLVVNAATLNAGITRMHSAPFITATASGEFTSNLPLQQQQALPPPTQPQAFPATGQSLPPITATTAQTYNNLEKSKRKERLEQNRISARESRKRKKSMIEELQRTVMTLTAENKDLNGRNQSLRSNLSDIGSKYPNSASIQAILSGVPTPSPQQHPQSPIPAATRGGPVMAAANNFLQQLTTPATVVPIMSATGHPMNASPPMVVPYMYIPQTAHAPGGLVQPVMVQAAPPPLPSQTTTAIPMTQQQQQQQQQPLLQQHHIVIAPQLASLAPPMAQQTMAPTVATPPILPAQAAPVAPMPAAPPVAEAPPPPAITAPYSAPTTIIQPMMEPVPNPMAAAAAESIQLINQEEQPAPPV